MNYVLGYNTVILSLLVLMWRSDTLPNLVIKAMLLAGAVAEGVLLAYSLGYMVHA